MQKRKDADVARHTKEGLRQQIGELSAQLRKLVDAEGRADKAKIHACAKECKQAGLHKCFTDKTMYLTPKGRVKILLVRSYEGQHNIDNMYVITPRTYSTIDFGVIERMADQAIAAEEVKMEKVFAQIRKVIAAHGLTNHERSVFELLDPEGD